MGDMGDFWRDVKPAWEERSRLKRESNREQSAAMNSSSGDAQ